MKPFAFSVAFAVLAVNSLSGESWPRFRGPHGDGTSGERSVPLKWGPDANIAWKVELPGPGASSPIVVGQRIVVTSFTGKKAEDIVRHVNCLDRTTGKLLWKNSYPASLPEMDYAGHLLQHGFATSTPASDGERLYVFFGRDGVRAFDLDGKLLWHESVGKIVSTFGSGASPVLHGDKLIVNATVELGAVVALDKKTGKRLWKSSINGDCWSTPALAKLEDGKEEVILNGTGAVYGIDPDNGQELWQVESLTGHISSTPVVRDGIVYVVNSGLNGKLTMAIRLGGRGDVSKTHVVWKQEKAGGSHCSPLLIDNRLCWFSGLAYALNTSNGAILQQERLSDLVNLYASPILAGDVIVLFTRNGGGYSLRAKDLAVISHNVLDDDSGINASPALSGGQLFIRSNRFLYCIGAAGK